MLGVSRILALTAIAGLWTDPVWGSEAGHDLAAVLATMDRHADFYRDNALRFSCDETIVLSTPGHPDIVLELEYIYVHEGERLADYRTWRRARRRNRPVTAVHPESHGLPFFLRRAYSWIFLFEGAKRDMYRYEILGEERISGEDALVISFDPVPPIRKDLNDWTGRAWVEADDYRILRIEALKKDDNDQKLALEAVLNSEPEDLPDGKEFVFTTISTEFDIEERGVLLPGKVEAIRHVHTVHSGRSANRSSEKRRFRVTQTYANYRFFGVETLDTFHGREVPR